MGRFISLLSRVHRTVFFLFLIFTILLPAPSGAIVHLCDEGDPGDGVLDPAKLETINSDAALTPGSGSEVVRLEPLPTVYRLPLAYFVGNGSLPPALWCIQWLPSQSPQWFTDPFRTGPTRHEAVTNSGRGW